MGYWDNRWTNNIKYEVYKKGDIIGLLLEMSRGKLTLYKNYKLIGTINVSKLPGAYYPAVSGRDGTTFKLLYPNPILLSPLPYGELPVPFPDSYPR